MTILDAPAAPTVHDSREPANQPAPLRSYALRVIAHCETGLVRRSNQDSAYASPTMLLVADGMGGAAGGDLASCVAVDELRRVDGAATGEQMLDALDQAIVRANERLAELIAHDDTLEGMGTTVCGGLFDGDDFALAHIGDSRAYLLRDGVLRRLTRDHSWIQSMIDEGRLTPEEAFTHPHRSLLLKVLNGQPYMHPDYILVGVSPGDRFLICSDGLSGLIDDDELGHLLSWPGRSRTMEDLIDAAHDAGGLDNLTIIIADVTENRAHRALGEAADEVFGGDDTRPLARRWALDVPGPLDELIEVDGQFHAGSVILGAARDSDALEIRQAAVLGVRPSSWARSAWSRLSGRGASGKPPQETPPLTMPWPEVDVIQSPGIASPAPDPGGDVTPWPSSADRVLAGTPLLTGARGSPRPSAPAKRATLAERERERYAPAKKPGHHVFLLFVALMAFCLILVGWAVYSYAKTQFFVGVNEEKVAIFQGFDGSVVGHPLYRLYEQTDIAVSDLPNALRADVTAGIRISQGGVDAAQQTVDQVRTRAEACVAHRTQQANPGQAPPPSLVDPGDLEGC